MTDTMKKTDAEWRATLSPEEYRVLREKGTERAFTGKYEHHHEPGVYRCAACGNVLFDADTKFESGSGWPSFYAPATGEAVRTEQDASMGMMRTEVLCAKCDSHLGHLFPDGPNPTGMRYCMNSISLRHEPPGDGGESR